MNESISTFFEKYAEALLSFSAENISGFYKTPLAIYSDQGVQLVHEDTEVLAFWKEGVKPYAAMNIERTVPAVLQVEQLSEKIFACKVQWNNYDPEGKEVESETNFYILTDNNGEISISGLIIMADVSLH